MDPRPWYMASVALVRDHLAVIRQRASADQFDIAAELRHRAQARSEFLLECSARRRRLRLQRHQIAFAGPRDDEAQPPEFGMALADLEIEERFDAGIDRALNVCSA